LRAHDVLPYLLVRNVLAAVWAFLPPSFPLLHHPFQDFDDVLAFGGLMIEVDRSEHVPLLPIQTTTDHMAPPNRRRSFHSGRPGMHAVSVGFAILSDSVRLQRLSDLGRVSWAGAGWIVNRDLDLDLSPEQVLLSLLFEEDGAGW
jgi:hypothetical protein